MRDLFGHSPSEDPVDAARRNARPVRRRFYSKATTAPAEGGYAVLLDDKPVRTPARRVLGAPTLSLAQAIASEWEAQRDIVDPATMPLTRLANSIIDGVVDAPQAVTDEIAKYLASDLLFYRVGGPQQLCDRQARLWDPVLAWAREALDADFKLGDGVVHIPQPNAAVAAARAAIPVDPWRLGAIHVVTTLTGSALLALAMAGGQLSVDAVAQAAQVDEDWNMEQWGKDEMALKRRASQFAELQAAATVLSKR